MKTVIITGAAKGIGKSTAFKYSKMGYNVFLIDILEEVNKVAKEINNKYNKAVAFIGDISKSEIVKESVNRAIEVFGSIDILVNNAGIVSTSGDNLYNKIEDISDEDIHSIFSVNTFSMFYFTREVVPYMKKNKNGVIINIGSVSSYGLASNYPYSASKSAIEGFTKSICRELAAFNIRVFCILPGFVNTDLIDPMEEKQLNMTISYTLTKELIPAWEIANMILYLSNDDAKNLTGQTIPITAGLFLR